MEYYTAMKNNGTLHEYGLSTETHRLEKRSHCTTMFQNNTVRREKAREVRVALAVRE